MSDRFSTSVDYDPRYGPPLIADPVAPGPHGEPVFEIGLVLAGAVSAGAYTGGVLDYLTEALDAFEKAKAAERAKHGADLSKWAVPGHAVRIRVISGASAGGMSAAMLAASHTIAFPHVHNAAEGASIGGDNPYYNAWVKQIDISGLLGVRDLKPDSDQTHTLVHSLLDCKPLEDILDWVLDYPAYAAAKGYAGITRGWLDRAPKLCMTITNLRGLPYSFEFPESKGAVYAMTRHADCQRFVLSPPAGPAFAPRGDEIGLVTTSSSANDLWKALGTAALATGSFPIALRSRTIKPIASFYGSTYVDVVGQPPEVDDAGKPVDPPKQGGKANWQNATTIVKHVSNARQDSNLSYASADGGMIDNEPLELARIELAGILGHNPREAAKANRAVLMVFPFPDPPDDSTFHEAETPNVIEQALRLLTVLKEQARFHPDDIRLALDADVYSRFMIYPSRATGPNAPVAGGKALACGALGAFSGFLCEAYRRHDFLLGRANCEKFLRKHFVLPIEDGGQRVGLFAAQPAALASDCRGENNQANGLRPIIPICDGACLTVLDPWPIDALKPEDLKGPLASRIKALGNALVGSSGFGGVLFKLVWNFPLLGSLLRGQMAGGLVDKIRKELEDFGLLSKTTAP